MYSEISVYIFDLSLEVSDYRALLYQAKTVKEIAGAAVLWKTLILIPVKAHNIFGAVMSYTKRI